MPALETYLRDLHDHRATTTPETSLYPALKALLDEAGARLKPKVVALAHPSNHGAGIADFGLFDARKPDIVPEHGVIEVKPVKDDLLATARSEQVERYLARYGLVLVTNFYQFVVVTPAGLEERYDLAPNAVTFWKAANTRARWPRSTRARCANI